jgi:hypothetical protein
MAKTMIFLIECAATGYSWLSPRVVDGLDSRQAVGDPLAYRCPETEIGYISEVEASQTNGEHTRSCRYTRKSWRREAALINSLRDSVSYPRLSGRWKRWAAVPVGGIVENHPWFSPFGRTRFARATKFVPDKFFEPTSLRDSGSYPRLSGR